VALGVPYNLAGYGFILQLFAHLAGLKPGIFGHSLVDAHVYTSKPDGSMAEYDHVPGLKEQITRTPKPLPQLVIDPSIKDLSDIEALLDPKVTTDDILRLFRLEGYNPHPKLSFKVAV
jgi:thymidylate synthase